MCALTADPKTVAAIVDASAKLPGVAVLVTAAGIAVKEAMELSTGDPGALDPGSLTAVAVLAVVGAYLVSRPRPQTQI